MLVTLHDLLARARAEGWALGAFNTYNMEITAAIVEAAEAQRAPVIVQTGSGALRGSSAEALPALALALATGATVPVALHLDHCSDLALIEQCLARGYTSIMVDGSAEPFEHNVTLTQQAVHMGHAARVTVEGELTGTAGDEDRASLPIDRDPAFTDPDRAEQFVRATGVDLLAVAIGNVHGRYHGEPNLDFALLDALRDRVSVPLVLHGASGLPDEAIRRAIAGGIVKVNFNTELRIAYVTALAGAMPEAVLDQDIVRLTQHAKGAVRAVVETKLVLLGAAGRA